MSLPGIDVTVAMAVVAAVGNFARSDTPGQLVCYLGLNPRVKQSGGAPATHGRITKVCLAQARGMLAERTTPLAGPASPLISGASSTAPPAPHPAEVPSLVPATTT